MPTTLNRNYPYPELTDAPNIPLALENLANAIDNDINTVAQSVPLGMASELETRATLLEGRLSTLENRQIKTTGGCEQRTNQSLSSGPLRYSATLPVPASRVIDYNLIASYLDYYGKQHLTLVSKELIEVDDRSCKIYTNYTSSANVSNVTIKLVWFAAYLV